MIARLPVTVFNRLCSAIVLFWLLLIGPAVMAVRPSPMDFPQFYMGGVIAQQGAWNDLYPTPLPGAWKNPGEPHTSTVTPRYEQLLDERNIPERFRFIQLPPNAVAFWPMAYLSWQHALILWTGVMAVFAWLTLRLAGRLLEELLGAPTRWAGVMMLAAGFSPMLIRSVRAGQVSCFIGFCIATIVWSLALRRGDARAGIAAALGFIAKYATVFLLPLAVILQRWRLIVSSVAFGVLVLIATLPMTGWKPYEVWLSNVAPTLDRGHEWDGNQSLHGLLLRTTGQQPLAQSTELALAGARWTAFAGVMAVLWWRRARLAQSAELTTIAATALLACMAIFSPIFWYHYAPYLLITFAWLWACIARGGPQRWAAAIVLTLLFWPICAEPSFDVPEPVNSLMLWANLLLLAMAIIALCKAPSTPANL